MWALEAVEGKTLKNQTCEVAAGGTETHKCSCFLPSTHFSSFLMGLLFTTCNTSCHQSCGLTRVYFSVYHLFLWLHESWSKQSQASSMDRELCKWYLSLHNPETTGNPLTLYSSTALLWSSSTRGENCWCLTYNKFATSHYWGSYKGRNRAHFKQHK